MSSLETPTGDEFGKRREPRIAPRRGSHSHGLNIHANREIVLAPGSEITLRVKTEEGSEETIELSRDALLSAGLSEQSHSERDQPVGALENRHHPATAEESSLRARNSENKEQDLIQGIREEYQDDQLVAVNRTTGEVITVASDDHDLTVQLLSTDYDEQNTLIIRTHA